MDEHKTPSKKPLIFYYVISLIVLMLLNALLFPALLQPRVMEVGYSDFLTMVDDGRVTEVVMDEAGEQILFLAKDDADKDKYYKTGLFPDPNLSQMCIRDRNELGLEGEVQAVCLKLFVDCLYDFIHALGRGVDADPPNGRCV